MFQGVRNAAGKQAEVLNSIVIPTLQDSNPNTNETSTGEKVTERGWRYIPLKESVGHTKLEVTVGSISGIILAILFHQLQLFT